jgi:hypothetical protein
MVPIPVAALSKARTAFNRSNNGIASLNPARGKDTRFSVLRCSVQVESFR